MYIRVILALLLFAFLPKPGLAHGYWLDVKGSGKVNDTVQIQICYGEIDDYGVRHRESGPELAWLSGFKLWVTDENGVVSDLVLIPGADNYGAYFVPHNKGVYRIMANHQSLPVVDRSDKKGQNVRPIEYLCATYSVGGIPGAAKAGQFLDIIVVPKDKLMLVKAYINNKPVPAGTRLRIFNPDNWEKNPVTDEKGEAVFIAKQQGLYIIRLDWSDAVSGKYNDIPYSAIRHRCNYCLWIP